ncbi:MAG: hypothetical protein JWL61_1354 [Gemmatimonadetes bacterium]|nr:hypothetical protein [Gemmatimonadota bacterium]
MFKSLSPLLLLLMACTRHFPMPMTAAQLAEEKDDGALIAYLGQRDASPTVCDLDARGPHLLALDADLRGELMDGLSDGRIPPSIWRDCVDRLMKSADRQSAVPLFDAVARSYEIALTDPRVEYDDKVQKRLAAMHALLLDRRNGVAPHSEVMVRLFADVSEAVDSHRLDTLATRYATELMSDVEMERGTRGGQPVDVAMLERLFGAGDEPALRRYALRLPDSMLRSDAQRRVIRLHIRTSPFPQVRENAGAVEETVMREGSNPVALRAHHPLRAWIDSAVTSDRGIRIRQDLRRGTATLLGDAKGGAVSVLPQLTLRGALHIELEGIDGPVTVCAPREELDPSPCVRAREVGIDSPLMFADADGTLHFVEHLFARDAAAIAANARRVSMPVVVDGQRLTALDWELQFETPEDLVFGGGTVGDDGPDVDVRVEALTTDRLSYIVKRGAEEYHAIVERPHARDFHVTSRGSDGSRGLDGSAGGHGGAGPAGISASCPSSEGTNGGRGGDGNAGGDGSNGGAGGRGGQILLELVSGGPNRDALLGILRGAVSSKGGSGGAGGSGGTGGRGGVGGTGGSGTMCTDSGGHVTVLSGGGSGLNGSDGRNGYAGSTGSNGDDGRVTVRVIE